MKFPDDPGLVKVLRRFRVEPEDYLGHGGEAWVYALGGARAIRVLHANGRIETVVRRQALVDELRKSCPVFALPNVLEARECDGRVFVVEERLKGTSVLRALGSAEGAARPRLVEAYLEAAFCLGDLRLDARGGFGELLRHDAIAIATWRGYLEARARRNLAQAPVEFASVDLATLVDELPEPERGAFVHLDAYAGNMLTVDGRITAVIDIGSTSVVGDRRFDPVSAVIYLMSPTITPTAGTVDADVAISWLRNAGLFSLLEPVRRWLGLFWLFGVDDPNVLAFCRSVLL
jgi:hypothetical protein